MIDLNTIINTVINEDALVILKQLDDKCINLICTDPPYGVRENREEGKTWDNRDNFLQNIDLWLNECFRVANTVIWFCASSMLPYVLKNKENNFHRLLIWNKPEGSQFAGAMHSNIWYSIEPILVFGKIPKTDKSKRYGYASFTYRTIPEKMFGFPTTKPLGLMEDLIYFYSNEGDIICDPFCGTGSTLVAAKKLNRKYIGIEINKDLIPIINKRLNNTNISSIISQQTLI